MKKKNKNEELQSRREFFRNAAKSALPILGVMAFGPSFLSCGGDSDNDEILPPSPSSGGDGSWMSPYCPSEAYNVANKLADGELTGEVRIKGRVNTILYNYDSEGGTATFYLSNLNGDGDILKVYRAYYLENKVYTNGALLTVGDEVLIVGKLSKYNGVPEVASKSGYLYSLNSNTTPSSTCSDCSAVCASNCSSECTSSCASNCSTSCSGACSGGCSTSCTGSCSGGCSTTCTGGCSTTCTTSCTGTAKGQCGTCTKSCMQTCGYGCKNTCSGECDTTCDNSCGGMCQSNCSHVGYGSYSCSICSGTCSRTCGTSCALNCSGTCTSTCKGTAS